MSYVWSQDGYTGRRFQRRNETTDSPESSLRLCLGCFPFNMPFFLFECRIRRLNDSSYHIGNDNDHPAGLIGLTVVYAAVIVVGTDLYFPWLTHRVLHSAPLQCQVRMAFENVAEPRGVGKADASA